MLTKSKYLKVIFTTLALSSSTAAVADETKFKIAVVKDTMGNHSIHVLNFNKNMTSCVAFTQAKKTNKSELSCTAAITSVKSIKKNNKKVKYLESLSYSNRGISRYMNDDISGAVDDFIAAILVDSNAITRGNLKLIKQLSSVGDSTSATERSD
ncbi:MAG: hypothetical protein ACI9LM_003481 [Alteromonadaceae bacterium]|jgi:hypothetical protein